jgi:type II secretion system protein I
LDKNLHAKIRIKARHIRSGFTLIEMIVATVLLYIGVVATVICISAATNNTSIASEYTTAALLAQQRFAEIEASTDQISPGEQQGQFDGEFRNFRWQQNIETDSTTPVYKVSIAVQWPSGMNLRTARFVSFIMAPSTSSTGTTTN